MTVRSAQAVDALVGARVAARRQALGLSQSRLGALIGVSWQQIQKYEAGQNRVSASRLYGLAVALNLPVEAFFPRAAEDAGQAGAADLYWRAAETREGRIVLDAMTRIPDPAVRDAVCRLVEVLAYAA